MAAFFPEEFNIGAAKLDVDELAKVLVHFAKQDIIAIQRTSAANSLKKVKPGWHVCHFYRDFNQLLDLIAPYMAEGLKNGEGCLWVMPAAVTSADACAALSRSIRDVDRYLASGQLELLSHPDWYLNAAGHLKSFEEIAGGLLERQDRALAKGYKFLRAAGDAGWVSGTEESKAFIDYEMKVNAAIRTTQVAAACTYRADVTADELIAIVTAHQDALSLAAA